MISGARTTPTWTAGTRPYVISYANPTCREYTWSGVLNFESVAFMHICAPCKITQQEQSKQMGMCRRKPQAPQGRGLCAAVTDGSFSIMSKGQVHSCGPDAVAWPHDLQYALNPGHRTMSHVCLFLPHGSANISTAWAQRYPCVKCLSENPSWPMTHQEQIFCQAARHLREELPPWGKNRLRHSQFWGQTTSLAANLRGSFSSLSGPPVCHPFSLVGVFNFFFFILCCWWPLHESMEEMSKSQTRSLGTWLVVWGIFTASS